MRILGYIVAALALTGVPQSVLAGGCGGYFCGRSYSSGYSYTPPVKTVVTFAPAVFIEVPLYQVLVGTAVVAPGSIQVAPLTLGGGVAPVASAAPLAPAAAAPLAAQRAATAPVEDPRLKALQEENRQLKSRLDAMEKRQAAPSSAPGEKAPEPQAADDARAGQVAGLLAARCESCHHETRSKERGGDFPLFRGGSFDGDTLAGGSLLAVGDDAFGEVLKRIAAPGLKQMPPPKSQGNHPPLTPAEQADVKWLIERLKAARAKG